MVKGIAPFISNTGFHTTLHGHNMLIYPRHRVPEPLVHHHHNPNSGCSHADSQMLTYTILHLAPDRFYRIQIWWVGRPLQLPHPMLLPWLVMIIVDMRRRIILHYHHTRESSLDRSLKGMEEGGWDSFSINKRIYTPPFYPSPFLSGAVAQLSSEYLGLWDCAAQLQPSLPPTPGEAWQELHPAVFWTHRESHRNGREALPLYILWRLALV